MSEYVDFHYMPLEGKITGEQVLKQTEDAINDLGNKVYNLDIDENRIDEAIENSEQAIDTANSALAAVTTDRAVWKNTVAEMIATDIDLGVTAATRGKMAFNDGNGAFYGVRSEKGGDVDSDDTVFLNNGNVAERIQSMNIIAKGNNIIFVANVAELIDSDALIGNVYGTTGYYSANDGGAGLYSIRTKTQSDVEDGGSIIFLDNGNVAELITDGTVNVRQFGAKGDETNDDTIAIQNAINASGNITVPHGTYKTTTTINIPSHRELIFEDDAKVVNSTTDNDVFGHINDADNADITITNATIEGNHSGDEQYGILIQGVANVKILNNTVTYCARGVRIKASDYAKVIGNTIEYCGFTSPSTDAAGLIVYDCDYATIKGNNCSHNTGRGISLLNSNDIDVIDNVCWCNSVIGIMGAGVIFYRLNVRGNSCCYNGTSVTAGAQGGINFHGCTDTVIAENICCNNYNYGIDINGSPETGSTVNRSQSVIISNNVVRDNQNIGIYAYKCKGVTITDNISQGNPINIRSTSSEEVSIINNRCYDATLVSGVSGTSSIHITSSKNVLIENNVLGQVNSDSTTTLEIIIDADVIGGIVVGYNDFHLAKRPKCFTISCTRDKIDFKDKQIFVSGEITLSGAEYYEQVPMLIPDHYSCIWKVYAYYTEATSVDAGVALGIAGGSSTTYWASGTSEVSKTIKDKTALTIQRNGQIINGDSANPPMFYCAGGKTGAGKIKMVVEYLPNVPIYY